MSGNRKRGIIGVN